MDCPLTHSGNDYDSNTCSPGTCSCISFQCNACGHYTQVVWRDSERLGCGVGDCTGGGEIWVCNYDPPGNVIPSGETKPSRPY